MAAADPEEMEAKLKAVLSKLDALEAEKTGYNNGRLAPRIEMFHGKSSEDAKLWLQRFEQVGEFYGWDDKKKVDAALLYLRGPAETWARTLGADVKGDYKKLKEVFLKKFDHKATKFLTDTRFHERKMGKDETVEAYLLDLQEMARQLDKPESDVLSQFLRGLVPSLKTLVMAQSPETLAHAAQLAMVTETVQKEQEATEKKDIKGKLRGMCTRLDDIKETLDQLQDQQATTMAPPAEYYQSPKPRRVRAVEQVPPKQARPDNRPTRPDRQDDRRWAADGRRGAPDNRRWAPDNRPGRPDNHPWRPDNRPWRPDTRQTRPNNQPYNARTTGQEDNPRCWNCGEEGHLRRNCPRGQASAFPTLGGMGIICYGCGQRGHIKRYCQNQMGRRHF